MSNVRTFTKSELLKYVKDELSTKSVETISLKSLEVIADILSIDLSDAKIVDNRTAGKSL